MSASKSYDDKRDFRRTPEPRGDDPERGEKSEDGRPVFVIQEHDASSHHYDLRLEVDGVLKSWAVPKGPSTDPREKRLAIPTEDHPLDYADFEGVIPEDEYGGGPVLIWDRGPWENLTEKDGEELSASDALDAGHLVFRLHGEKLTGGYSLKRTGSGDDARWLLVKMRDDDADARRNPTSTEPESVASGRTIDAVEDEDEDGDGEDGR